ncbi:MAG: DNA polymerase elongation subunit (family B), partial [Epsilonproteobacteria bacterium]|nr:DNA polymerase elongation subunit (family B) [Campylobacterota bacterium]
MSSDIISGHNIIGFDNFQIYNRISWFLKNSNDSISNEKKKVLQLFITKYSNPDKSFHFGISSDAVQLYPSCLDTYLGVRKFYSFLNDFSLKSVAPFLGVKIKDRIILTPSQIKIDEKTLKYNKQDVQEQLGVTLNLVQQSLPLAFTTCMPFDMLLSSGAVNMWDHMSMIRSSIQKKIMPPICRVLSIAEVLTKDFKDCKTREEIVKKAKNRKEQLSKDFIRVIKYGDEMPSWMEYPYVIYNENSKDSEDILNYHMPGGMTIKPDKEANSHFIPWWYVVVADVGAMYPTILKAMNVGADTVRLAKKDEIPDDFIWLKKIPKNFLVEKNIFYRDVNKNDSFADKGFIIGIKIDVKQGVVNCAMTGIMSMIAKTKKELKDASKTNDKSEIQRLKMMYQSVKGARNAGTHGILAAPGVSGRQFNLWGAAAITTKGQAILDDTLHYLKNKGIRVVYGDTDGIYIGCSRSVGN